jgi:hypothetical protein
MRQRAVDVVQQPVQGVSNDSDLVVGVGVFWPDPHTDLVIVADQRHRRDLGRGRGHSAQRTKGIAHHPCGDRGRDQQRGRHQHSGRELFAGDDLVGDAQRNPDDQAVVSSGAAIYLVGTKGAQVLDARLAVSPRLRFDGTDGVRRRGPRFVLGENGRGHDLALANDGDQVSWRLSGELEQCLRDGGNAGVDRSMFPVAVSGERVTERMHGFGDFGVVHRGDVAAQTQH